MSFLKDFFMTEKIEMTQLERLQKLVNQPSKSNNMTAFNGLVVVNVGCQPKEHFPKLQDKNGKKIVDSTGYVQHAKYRDGWMYTFSQFNTAKMVKVILPQQIELDLLQPYQISGLGYDIRNANIIYLEKDIKISKY